MNIYSPTDETDPMLEYETQCRRLPIPSKFYTAIHTKYTTGKPPGTSMRWVCGQRHQNQTKLTQTPATGNTATPEKEETTRHPITAFHENEAIRIQYHVSVISRGLLSSAIRLPLLVLPGMPWRLKFCTDQQRSKGYREFACL